MRSPPLVAAFAFAAFGLVACSKEERKQAAAPPESAAPSPAPAEPVTPPAAPAPAPAEPAEPAKPVDPAPAEPGKTPAEPAAPPVPADPGEASPEPTDPEPHDPEPTDPEPAKPKRPKRPGKTGSLPAQGLPCADGMCAAGLTCVEYYGVAGPRGPAMSSCEIRCPGGKGCPAGQICTTIADGPGQVCRAP
jgi:hypothetical protein